MEPDKEDAIGQIRDMRVFIETYGCTYNLGDTEKIKVILTSQGCEIVETADDADCILINTCIVIERTEREMRKRLEWYSGHKLFVTGCLPKIDYGCGGVVIDPDTIHSHFREAGGHPQGNPAILQVAQGCPGHCTYCITRKARGPLLSHSIDEMLRQLRGRIAQGAVEVQLTAQDLSAWGIERGETLADLIEAIKTVPGSYRIRLGMMNPDTLRPIIDSVLTSCRDDRIFSFFHIPVQSGSDRILNQMGRRYSRDDVIELIWTIRSAFPDARISTDIICGFPGETDEEFLETIDLLRAMEPEKINITRYSNRPGTPAAGWYDMPDRYKKDRSRRATAVAGEIFDRIYSSFIGQEMDLIVTEVVQEGSVTARDHAYRPVILQEALPIGSFCRAMITGHRRHYLIGKRIS
ncbi:MiaB/RimO family radical SAM methylthiotransferase [Methanocalculus taiwanensis]|nr:MiaB/RimO family radical SAM methylthiotransferase [Methanocalculus taiwanensis]